MSKRRFEIETELLDPRSKNKGYREGYEDREPFLNLRSLRQAQFIPKTGQSKYYGFMSGNYCNAAGTWTSGGCLNTIAEGTGITDRIGKQIRITKIQLRYTIEPAADQCNKCRLLIVYDQQANGSIPAITDILDDHATGHEIDWFNNLDNSHRFITLVDELSETSSTYQNTAVGSIVRNIDLKTIYKASSASVTAIATGSIYFFYCQALVSPSTSCLMSFNTRIRYTDV